MNNTILDGLKEAKRNYETALITKQGLQQAKTIYTNLLIEHANELIFNCEIVRKEYDELKIALDKALLQKASKSRKKPTQE